MRNPARGLPARDRPAGRRRGLPVIAVVLALAAAAWAQPATAAPGDISTVAGDGTNAFSGDGGPATAAATGDVEGVFATSGGFHLNQGAGRRVRFVDAGGTITTVAGGGTSDPGDGGPGTAALLGHPEQVIRDRDGNVFFSEGNRVRRVSALGVITTVAGTGAAGFSGDGGAATAAQLARPHGLALDLDGNLYIGDCDNYRVRRVNTLGAISTVAGTGVPGYTGDNGPAAAASLACPVDVAIDGSGRLLIAANASHVVRRVDTGGTITTIAGTGTAGHTGDGGAATAAQIAGPQGIDVDGAGSIYIAGSGNHVIRKVDAGGTITTVAGTPATAGFTGDGGPATAAQLSGPREVSFDYATGDFYIADKGNNRVRRVEALGAPNVPPAVTIDSSPASPGTDRTPTWSFSAPSAQERNLECRLSRGGAPVFDWAQCSSPKTYDLSAQPDGTYTFEVRAVTVAGVGAPTSSSYSFETLDHFELDPIAEQVSGRPFDVTVRAKTGSGLTDSAFTGTVALLVNSGSIAPGSSGAFVNGVRTQTVTVTGTYAPGTTLTASGDSGVTGTSNAFLLHDHKYYFKQTTAFTGAGCAGAFAKRDMEEGYAGQDPEETHRRYSGGAETINFCSPALPAALDLPAGSARVRAYVDSTLGSTCDISATLMLNGTTTIGTATRTIPPFASLAQFTWTISYGATTIAAGDKVNLRFQMAPVKACSQTSIHYGGTVNRSHLELLAGSGVPTITAGPGGAGSSRVPAWEFTGEAGATFECRLEDSTGAPVGGYDWAGCASPHGFDLTGFPDGGYTFAVRQTSGGITSPAARSDYVLDTATPAAPAIDASPPSPSSDTTVSWDFSGEEDAAFECRLLKGVVVVSAFASCSASQGYTLVDGDGGYTFEVRQTDAAGNVSIVAASAYELDTSAPAAPSIDSPPPSPGNDVTPSWGFSGETGATFECRLEQGATVVSGWASCSSPHSYDVSAMPDDTYTFSVRETDAAGNVSPAATDDYELDTSAPAAPAIGTDPGATGSDPTPTWGFSGEAGTPFECRLTRGGAVVSDWASCSSPKTYDLSAEPDGDYTFAVRQTDAAGNVGAEQSHDYALDRSLPAAPSIDSAPASPDNSTAPSWAFSGEAGATFECRLERMDGSAVSDWSSCTSPRAYDLAAELDGAYGFSVRQTDAAGNTSAAADSWYVMDTTPGAAPSIDSTPGSPGTDSSPTWDFSGELGATFECRVARGGTVVLDWGACSGPATFDLSGEPDGTYTFSVRQIDAAGNTSPAATDDYELDTQAPGAPSIDSGPASPGNDSGPAFGFSGEPGGAFECRLEDGAGTPVPGYDWTACWSPESYDLSASPDGAYSFAVRQVDDAGSTGPAATRGYVLDTTPPPAPTFTAEPPLAGSATNPSWSFTGVAGAGFECRVERGATTVFGWAACSSPHTLDLSGAPDGLYALSIRATDAAGNTGPAVTDLYSLDRSPPAPPTVTETPGAVGNDSTPSWSFTVEAGALPECRLERGASAISDWQPCASPASYHLTAEPYGAYRFLVRARDAAGNAGSEAQSDYVLDRVAPPAPSIDSTPGALGASRTPAWGFTGEPGALHECRLTNEGGVVSGWASCATPATYDLAGEPDGSYEFAVRSRDEAGNTGAAATSSYRLDTAGADVAIDGGPGALGNDATPSWAFSGEPGARFECALDLDGATSEDWAPCSSPTEYDLAGRGDGDYTFRVRARDDADNLGAVASYAYTLDRAAPPAPEFTASPARVGRDATPAWELAAEDGATIECRLLRAGSALGEWEPCAGGVSRDLSGTGDGDYALVARATDRAANVSPTSQSDYRLDATAPDAPDITDGPGSSGRARHVSWAFTGEPAAAFECRLGQGSVALDPWGTCSSPARFSLVESDPGGHVFRVRARDQAGNLGPSTSSDYELLAPPDDEPRDEPRDDERDERPAAGPSPAGAAAPVAPLVPVEDLGDPPASAAAKPAGADRADSGREARRDRDGERSSDASPGIAFDDESGTPGPRPSTGERSAPDGDSAAERLLDALGAAAAFVGRNLDKTGFPLLLLLVVLGYVAVQNRLDSRDPKLALAPMHADRDLEFLPPPNPNVPFLPASPTPMTS